MPLPSSPPPPEVDLESTEDIPSEEQIPSPYEIAVNIGNSKIKRNQDLWRGNTFSKRTDGINKDLE